MKVTRPAVRTDPGTWIDSVMCSRCRAMLWVGEGDLKVEPVGGGLIVTCPECEHDIPENPPWDVKCRVVDAEWARVTRGNPAFEKPSIQDVKAQHYEAERAWVNRVMLGVALGAALIVVVMWLAIP